MREKYYIKKDKKSFFYPQEFQKILDLANEHQKFTLLFLINTGARINEIRHVEKKDLDKERETIYLRITKIRAKLKETRPNPRKIPVSAKFFKYLRKNIKKYKIHSTSATGKFVKKLCKKIGMQNWQDMSPHNLRKTLGTWLLALNINGFKVARHLGHSANMLLTHYASADIFNIDDKDRMREILDNLPMRMRG